jgi:hypothetical protein
MGQGKGEVGRVLSPVRRRKTPVLVCAPVVQWDLRCKSAFSRASRGSSTVTSLRIPDGEGGEGEEGTSTTYLSFLQKDWDHLRGES